MIRRIILFLWLLLIAFFAYRRYNQAAADQLLYKIKTLSFKKSTNTYTTTVDGKVISPDTTKVTTTISWSDTITQNIATITQMTNDAMKIETGTIINTGQKTIVSNDFLATSLLSQAHTNSILISLQWTSILSTGASQNDVLIDEIIGRVIEPSTGDNQTGSTNTNTGQTTINIQALKAKIAAAKEKSTQQTATTIDTTTSNTPLSSQDKEEASDFLWAFSQD